MARRPAPRSSATSRRGRSRTPPATRASTTTSSTWRPAAASGSASCPRSTRRSCSPACSPAAAYFDRDTDDEAEVRRLADALYRRADWHWARNGGATLTHGWRPETGFIPHRCEGYDEALLLYVLGLGSPTLPAAAGELRRLLLDLPVEADLRPRVALLRAAVHPPALAPLDRLPRHPRRLHARPRQRLLREQPAGDLRAAGVRASATRCSSPATGSTAGGSRPATAPAGRSGWSTASSGSSSTTSPAARPFGPDDGTVAPWVVVASLPFAPEIVIPTVRHLAGLDLGGMTGRTASRRRSTRRSAWTTARPAGG